MDYIVIAFRSRTHTIKFSEFLKKSGVENEIINTPKEAGVGCGLSVKISSQVFPIVKNYIKYVNLSSYAGSFLVKVNKGGKSIRNAY